MGKNTKIDWCDATWNPVTGCLHGCEYCYARRIAERFGAMKKINEAMRTGIATNEIFFVDESEKDKSDVFYTKINLGTLTGVKPEPCRLNCRVWVNGKPNPYPFGFTPTFHRYLLDEPQKWKNPKNIFVCSMADLFGDWVPDEWIHEVFRACEAAPQHRYLFLTKNPKRYYDLMDNGICADSNTKMFFGYTMDGMHAPTRPLPKGFGTFVSIEPIITRLTKTELNDATATEWVIIGAETGNRKGRVIPEKAAWITEIAERCDEEGVPVFMKESLRGLMGDDFKQEYPWEKRA